MSLRSFAGSERYLSISCSVCEGALLRSADLSGSVMPTANIKSSRSMSLKL